MIRTLIEQDGGVLEGGRELASQGRVRWLDIQAQTPEEIAWLGTTFYFHPLALEDCLHLGQRPKLETYPEALFVVLHTFSWEGDDPCDLDLHEIHFFVTGDTLVSVHADAMPQVESVLARARDPRVLGRGPMSLLHLVCDALVDAEAPVLTAIHETIDDLEELALVSLDPRLLERVFRIKKAILQLRRTLDPAREVYLQLARHGEEREKSALYFRDVLDHALRNAAQLEAARERVNDTLGAYHSMATYQTNKVIKRLAVFSAVFLPLTFITGFFGMNFAHLPFDNDPLLVGAMVSMVVLPVAMVLWFHFSRWV